MSAAVTRLPTAQRAELIFRLGSDTIEEDIVRFLHREVRFLHDHLGMTFAEMHRITGISASSIANYYHGKVKHPQLRTSFALLAYLELEFDPVTMAIRRREDGA